MSDSMNDSQILSDFNIESIKRLRTGLGLFESLALSVQYNYTFQQYQRGCILFEQEKEIPEVIKTMFHETTHLYQMISTPYGYYYYSLRDLQTNQVIALIKVLKDTYGIKIQFPLIDLIASLKPKENFRELWGILYLWYIAEIVLLYFEGDVDIYLKQRLHNPLLTQKSFTGFFAEIEFYLNKFYAVTGRNIEYSGHNLSPHQNTQKVEKLNIVLKATADTDVMALLESGAKISEYWGSQAQAFPDLPQLFPKSMEASQIKYYFLLNIAKNRLKATNISEFVLTYAALCELSLFGPILPHYSKFRDDQTAITGIHPLSRFMDASAAAAKIQPVRNLGSDYTRFVEEICTALKWPTPLKISQDTLTNFPYHPLDRLSELYYRAQQFRTYRPSSFIDLSIWYTQHDSFTRNFIYYFVHPVIEFKDKLLFHKDKELVQYFVMRYVLTNYLRRLLLTNDLTVTLPYAAENDEITYFKGILASYLEIVVGINNPFISIRSGTQWQH